MKLKPLNLKAWLTTLSLATLLSLPGAVYAAPGTLEQTPLYVGPAVESNIVILNDDSGSMDWESMVTGGSGLLWGTQPDGSNQGVGGYKHTDLFNDGTTDCGFPYYYGVLFLNNSYRTWTEVDAPLPGRNWLFGCNVADDEAWRFRSNDFNPLYFDPTRTYLPWGGVDASGNPYTNALLTNAPNDPYNPTEWINLTTDSATTIPGWGWTLTGDDWAFNNGTARLPTDGFRYYTWSDDGDGLFENGEETEFLIKDQNATIQQNFANWFSYHRSREYVVKYAMSQALKDVTGVKVGYGTINNIDSVNIAVETMNSDPAVGNKRALFNNLFRTRSAASTPLRRNLRNVGRYFECAPGNFFGVSGANCPILPASEYGMCQKNFTIMLTDGFYNGGSPSLGNTDADGPGEFDGGDYADNISNTLADVAMHYYERDLATSLNDEVPPSGLDNAPHQHMTTFTVAFGVTGNLDPGDLKTPGDASDSDPSDPGFNWPTPNSNPGRIDDLWHTAFNGRGDFFSAQDPDELIAAIQAAVTSASKGSSSASAVAFNTSKLDTGTAVYQALFNPADNWKGELIATDINIDGSLASSPKWNAGDELNARNATSRKIITYNKDLNDPENSVGIPFRILGNLSAAQQADLNMGPTSADGNGQARLDYLRGDRSNESTNLMFRDRTNVLGDLVHSNPVFVGKPRARYPDTAPYPITTGELYSEFKAAYSPDPGTGLGGRDGMIYIGANDGMLHGFDEATGNEVFAYIPNALFSADSYEGLHYLTDPTYAHRYYVDLSPAVADVYINSDWRTLLVGGLGAGGRGLFALDVTDPTVLATAENNADTIVQWEFTSDDDPDLGFVMSKAAIAKMANGRWAAIVSNGYNSSGDGRAKLFIIYLDGGQDGVWTLNTDYFKIDTGVGSLTDLNGLSAPVVIDTNGDELADRVYAGDLRGNLWAFDLSDDSTSSPNWEVAYKQGQTPRPLFTARDVDNNIQPITSRPVISRQKEVSDANNNAPNLMVFFGTGQYIVTGDKTSTATQTFYGVWDKGTDDLERSDLLNQALDSANTTADERVMEDDPISYSTQEGWLIDLPADGERVTVNPIVAGNIVIFATLIPGAELCLPEGAGWIMLVNQSNGGQPDNSVFDVNNDGIIDDNDKINGSSVSGFRIGGIPGGLGTIGDFLVVTDDDGNMYFKKFEPEKKLGEGRLSWQELMR